MNKPFAQKIGPQWALFDNGGWRDGVLLCVDENSLNDLLNYAKRMRYGPWYDSRKSTGATPQSV